MRYAQWCEYIRRIAYETIWCEKLNFLVEEEVGVIKKYG